MNERVRAAADRLLAQRPGLRLDYDEPMSEHTSFRIGGPAPLMLSPENAEELALCVVVLSECGLPFRILGNGTNVLCADGPMGFAVVRTGRVNGIRLMGEGRIGVECGVTLSAAAVFAMEHSLTGMEFAHGIPGSLGGAVYMNAGAYGGEMKDIVETVTVLHEGQTVAYPAAECDFAYRHSRFTDGDDLILGATLALFPGDSEEIRARMAELAAKRRASQPLDKPSAGSTFKRPATGYAAAMIEQAGLKGYTVGGAQVSEKHAGFVVNVDGATCEDVLAVMRHARQSVFERFGVTLEPEVKIWN